MSKKKITAKEAFLNSFGDFYKKELPQDDDNMFIELCAIAVTRETFQMTDNITEFVISPVEAKSKKQFIKSRNMFLKGCYNNFIDYICETKGYVAKGMTREYRNWYIEMSGKYEKNKEEWSVRIKEASTYFSNITRFYMLEKSFS